MAAVVFCTAMTEGQAAAVVNGLRLAGLPPADISVLLPGRGAQHEQETYPGAPEGAPGHLQAEHGAILGGALEWMTGSGALALPEIGLFIGAGPIMAQLASPGRQWERSLRSGDGLRRVFLELGMPDYEARIYEGRLREGGVFIAVNVEDERQREIARAVCEREGAEDISVAHEVAIHGPQT